MTGFEFEDDGHILLARHGIERVSPSGKPVDIAAGRGYPVVNNLANLDLERDGSGAIYAFTNREQFKIDRLPPPASSSVPSSPTDLLKLRKPLFTHDLHLHTSWYPPWSPYWAAPGSSSGTDKNSKPTILKAKWFVPAPPVSRGSHRSCLGPRRNHPGQHFRQSYPAL